MTREQLLQTIIEDPRVTDGLRWWAELVYWSLMEEHASQSKF